MHTELKRVQSTKGQGPVSCQTPAHSTYSVRVNCMHYLMCTFSENVQLSAADLDLASLGSQACEEREREREREREGGGGGLKGSAHFALQILVGSALPTLSTFTCTHYNTHALGHYTQTVFTTFVLSNFILILSYTYNFHTRWYLRTHFPPPSDRQLQCQRQLNSCLSPRGNSILLY